MFNRIAFCVTSMIEMVMPLYSTLKRSNLIVVTTMKNQNYVILIFVGLFLMAGKNASAENLINWYIDDSPPCHIATGTMAGEGFCDKIQNDIIKGLPEYHHNTIRANWSRILADFKTQSDVCKTFMLKIPDRESYIRYSDPVIITPSSAVIFRNGDRKAIAPYITEGDQVNLKQLLDNEPQLVIGVIKTQTLGPFIEPLIGPLRNTSRVYERSAKDYAGLFKMLSLKRVDIVIMVPLGVVHYLRQPEFTGEAITALPVHGAKNYHVFYAGCSKKEHGDQIIDKINQILSKNRKTFATYRNEWFDTSMVQAYQQIFEKVKEE